MRASVSRSSRGLRPMSMRSTTPEEATVFEPFLGLAVALGLGVYLVVTLLYPERF